MFGFSCGCIGLLLGWGVDGLRVLWVLVYDALCVGGGWLRGLVLPGIVLGCCDRFCLCSGFRGGLGWDWEGLVFWCLVFWLLVLGFGVFVWFCEFRV